MQFLNKFSNDHQGIIYMVLACFFTAIMIGIIRYLTEYYHVFFIVMVRNFFALIFFFPQIINDYQKLLKTSKPKLHLIRAIIGIVSMSMWFQALSILPLSEVVALSFVIPIISTVLAIIFLKEKVNKLTWLVCVIAFIGVMVILRPGFHHLSNAYFYVLGSVILWSFADLLIKVMTKTEKPGTIAAYMSLIMLIISIPLSFPYLQPLNLTTLFLFIILGICSNLTHISISISYGKTNLSKVQPFCFSRLIFVTIIAYFFFDEVIDFWTIVGSLIILFATILIMPRRKKKSKVATIEV